MASFEFKRLDTFDNMETMYSHDENAYFPFHFHDLYCVSLILNGTEVLMNPEQDFIAPAGMISVTQKDEVHRNFSLSEQGYSYKTFYVNAEVLRFYNGGKPIPGLARVIDDPALFNSLLSLSGESTMNVKTWESAFRRLAGFAEKPLQKTHWSTTFYLIDEIIETESQLVTDTGWLAGKFCMSKFHFIREFKKAKGVTPQCYIMLYRLAKAKEMLLKQVPLRDIAYLNGFYDASHFTNTFKRYFGFNPSAYMGQ